MECQEFLHLCRGMSFRGGGYFVQFRMFPCGDIWLLCTKSSHRITFLANKQGNFYNLYTCVKVCYSGGNYLFLIDFTVKVSILIKVFN